MSQLSSFAGRDGDLQVLWEEGECAFCRAWHEAEDGERSAMLAVVPTSEHPSPRCLDRLAHEFGLKDVLDGAWAARPLILERQSGTSTLMLEDQGGEPLARRLGTPMAMDNFLPLAMGISTALGKVHSSGLVHKDLKPAHLLVNCADGLVRLTGFGLASRLPRERQAPAPPEFIAGTLAYMAPEQTGRMNRSIDSRSDLYALGVALYQMLTGDAAIHGLRSHGVGPLPHRQKAGAARRAVGDDPGPGLRNRHEAARQDRGGALPDRRRRRARSAALPGRLGSERPHR